MNISSVDKEILKVLDSGFYFVPRFQRPYSWTQGNVEEFWNDLKDSFDEEYFIGSMVVYKRGQNSYGIVDGQQRLTTITMILCALREKMKATGLISLANGIHKLVERADLDDKLQFVLQTETSYPYLQEAIQRSPQITTGLDEGTEEKNLRTAYKYITKSIEDYLKSRLGKNSGSDKLKPELTILRDKVLKLKVIFIDLDNEDDAYVVFETLNARGKDLEVSDLVKSHVTKLWKVKNKRVDRAFDRWKEISSILGAASKTISIDDFLLHYWLSKHDSVSKARLFGKIKTAITKNNVEGFVTELKKEAEYYRILYDPEFGNWNKNEQAIFSSLKALTIFQVKQPMPLLLAGLSALRAKKISVRNARILFSVIEKFHFIATAILSQSSSGGTSTLYSSMARSLRAASKDETGTLIRDFERKMRSKLPSEIEFVSSFTEIKYSDRFQKQKKLVQYILEKFDDFGNSSHQPIDYEKMTIEHIAAQNPRSGESLPDDSIANIGNLLFVSSHINEKLENKNFSAKKSIISRVTNNSTDHGLKMASIWDAVNIDLRAKSMGGFAYSQIWKI